MKPAPRSSVYAPFVSFFLIGVAFAPPSIAQPPLGLLAPLAAGTAIPAEVLYPAAILVDDLLRARQGTK